MAIKFKKTTSPAQRRAIRKMIASRKGSKLKGSSTMRKTRSKTPSRPRPQTRTVTKTVYRKMRGSYETDMKELGKATIGGLLAVWLINITPKVNTFSPLLKGLVLVAVGYIGGQKVKKKFYKQLLAGTSFAGALTGTLPILQKYAPEAKLSGGRALTTSEVQALLGAPYNVLTNQMSAPIDLANEMSAPIDVLDNSGMNGDSYYTY